MDQGGCAEVGRNADVFEDVCRGDHGLRGGEVEVVGTWSDGLGPGGGDGGHEGGYVSCFGHADHFQVGDVLGSETQSSEVRVGEFGESLLVECGFEILKCESARSRN